MTRDRFRRLLFILYAAGFALGVFADRAYPSDLPDDANVNCRYTVEGVDFEGDKTHTLSRSVRAEIQQLIGEHFDPQVFQELASRIQKELKAAKVAQRLVKGSSPETIRVVYQVVYDRLKWNTASSRFAYQSNYGWTGDLNLNYKGFRLGVVSNGDDLLERFAGIRAGLTHRIASPRVRLSFLFEDLHQQWNNATLAALANSTEVDGVYRQRQSFQPTIEFQPTENVIVSTGFAIDRLEMQRPGGAWQSINAFKADVRYRRARGDAGELLHTTEIGYNLKAASSVLSSDKEYTRHQVRAGYTMQLEDELLLMDFLGGYTAGNAPLYDRFVIGTSTSLRGWDKFELAPLGGSRLTAGTMEFRHRFAHKAWAAMFYDTGSVWDRNSGATLRHSAGLGLRSAGQGFYFYVGFPLRDGPMTPVFIVGANF